MKTYPRYFLLSPAVIFGLLLFAAALSFMNIQSAKAQSENMSPETVCASNRSIQVTGSALINVTPDRALIQLGVQSNGTTVKAVEQANSSAINRVIEAIRKSGVENKDIATDFFVIEPIYEEYDSLYIKGYRIYNTVSVTVRDVKNTSQVVAAALSAGANQVNDVNFYTSDLRKYRDQAREMAVKAAGEKAAALTKAAGAETGCVLNINENSWSYYNGWRYDSSRNDNLWTQNAVQNINASSGHGDDTEGDEPLSSGQIAVKAEVSISYSVK